MSLFSVDLPLAQMVYLDTEFSDLLNPELLSVGLVSASGDEHYVELDLDTADGRRALLNASDFVKHCGVVEQWGQVPEATMGYQAMGDRTAAWLVDHARRFAAPLIVAYDYDTDFELLEYLLRDAGHLEQIRTFVEPLNIDELTSRFDGSLGAEAAFMALRRRGLQRHHALADAHALRAACIAVATGKRVRL